MKLTYYGTAAAEAWPGLFCTCAACTRARALGGKNLRSRAQAAVDDRLLLDFGPDTGLHALHGGLPLYRMTDCLITHGHADHFYPSDLIMKAGPYAENGAARPLALYGSPWVEGLYRRAREIDDDTADLDDCVRFHPVEAFTPFTAGPYAVTPLAASHNPPEPCLLYLIRDPEGKTLLYAHDTGWFPQETWDALAGARLDLVSLDCTLGTQGDGSTHLGLPGCERTRALLLERGVAHSGTVFVLSHFSHNGWPGLCHEEMEALAAEKGFLTAWDGFSVTV